MKTSVILCRLYIDIYLLFSVILFPVIVINIEFPGWTLRVYAGARLIINFSYLFILFITLEKSGVSIFNVENGQELVFYEIKNKTHFW